MTAARLAPDPLSRPVACPDSGLALPVVGADLARCPVCGALVAVELDCDLGPVLARHPAPVAQAAA